MMCPSERVPGGVRCARGLTHAGDHVCVTGICTWPRAPRCEATAPASGVRCVKLPLHKGMHLSWGGATWPLTFPSRCAATLYNQSKRCLKDSGHTENEHFALDGTTWLATSPPLITSSLRLDFSAYDPVIPCIAYRGKNHCSLGNGHDGQHKSSPVLWADEPQPGPCKKELWYGAPPDCTRPEGHCGEHRVKFESTGVLAEDGRKVKVL